MADSNASRARANQAPAKVPASDRLVRVLLILQLASGAALLWFFEPGPQAAWISLVDLREVGDFGWLRPFHRWGSHALVGMAALYLLRTFLGSEYRASTRTWVYSSALLVLCLLTAATGYPLPADRAASAAVPELATLSTVELYALHAFFLPLGLLLLIAWRRRSVEGR